MDNKDEYIVVIEKIGNRFYYKNGKLHREAGPAYVPWKLKEVYTALSDQELYKPVFTSSADEKSYETYAITETAYYTGNDSPLIEYITERKKILNRPEDERYHLDGEEYPKEEFHAIILENQLNKKESTILPKKTKI